MFLVWLKDALGCSSVVVDLAVDVDLVPLASIVLVSVHVLEQLELGCGLLQLEVVLFRRLPWLEVSKDVFQRVLLVDVVLVGAERMLQVGDELLLRHGVQDCCVVDLQSPLLLE